MSLFPRFRASDLWSAEEHKQAREANEEMIRRRKFRNMCIASAQRRKYASNLPDEAGEDEETPPPPRRSARLMEKERLETLLQRSSRTRRAPERLMY